VKLYKKNYFLIGFFDRSKGGTKYYTYNGKSARTWNKTTNKVTLYAHYLKGKPIYRLFNPNATDAGSHFYTDSKSEGNDLKRKGWKYDNGAKPVFYAFAKTKQRPGTIQTHRYYMEKLGNPYTGDHMYVTSTKDRRNLIRLGYNYEGARFYVVPKSKIDSSSTKMYLATNPNTNEHLYTTSLKEYNDIYSKGWKKTGTPFFVVR
jgi:hypothetical protein